MAKHEFGNDILESYEIGEMLGSGSFATVYRAIQKNLKRPVAIKVLKQGRLKSADSIRRFNREALLLSKISHPSVVQIFDFGLDDGVPYLVQELVKGETLSERQKRVKTFSLSEAVKICDGVCAALEEAHDRGILHRDLKPANILLCDDGQVKLLDFGLARSYLGDETRMTQDGALIGTPLYMAPEQLLGMEATLSTDLYAVGVMLYELLVGDFPFPPSLEEITREKEKDDVSLSKVSLLGHDKRVEELLSSLMAHDAEKRPKSAKELRYLLRKLIKIRPKSEQSKVDQVSPVKEGKKQYGRHVLVPFLLLLIVPILFFVFLKDSGQRKKIETTIPLTIRSVSIDNFGATALTISCATSVRAHLKAIVRPSAEETILLERRSTKVSRNHKFQLSSLPPQSSLRVTLIATSLGSSSTSVRTKEEVHRSLTAQTGKVKSKFYWSAFGKELPVGTKDFSKVTSVLSSRIHGIPGRKGSQFVLYVGGRGMYSLVVPETKPLWHLEKLTTSRFAAKGLGLLYLNSKDGHVHCCTWEQGLVKWHRELGINLWTGGHFIEGNLVLTSKESGLWAIDGLTGQNRWTKKGQCVEHETIVTPFGLLARLAPDRAFYLLSGKDGSVIRKLDQWPLGTSCTPLVIGEELVFANGRSFAICNPKGSIRLRKELEGRITFINSFGGDILVVSKEPNIILALSPADGYVRWQRRVPIRVTTPLTAARGHLYCVDDREHLLCLDHASGRILYRLPFDLSDNFGIFPIEKELLVCTDTGDLLLIDDR